MYNTTGPLLTMAPRNSTGCVVVASFPINSVLYTYFHVRKYKGQILTIFILKVSYILDVLVYMTKVLLRSIFTPRTSPWSRSKPWTRYTTAVI